MQSDFKELAKLTSWKTGIEEQKYIDIFRFVCNDTAKQLKEPKNLIYFLKGIGSWYLRKKRLEIKLELFYDYNPGLCASIGVDEAELPRMMQIFTDRLEDYKKYTNLKQETKIRKDEARALLSTLDGEDTSKEETKTDLE